jgi:hypothetical protein
MSSLLSSLKTLEYRGIATYPCVVSELRNGLCSLKSILESHKTETTQLLKTGHAFNVINQFNQWLTLVDKGEKRH